MGHRAVPLRFVCRGCGQDSETYATSNKGVYCSKACRANYERKGAAAPRRYRQAGYWMLCWTEPGGTKYHPVRRFQFEHRRVWEAANGPIPTGLIIHHVNGDKSDNRIENLRLVRCREHSAIHQALGAYRKMAE